MRVKQLLVLPKLPPKIAGLQELAHNLWYSWNWDVVKLFIRLDAEEWERCSQNPVKMLSQLSQETLKKAAEDDGFVASLERARARFDQYVARPKWFERTYRQYQDRTVAYFSLEYGLDTGLPVYSGGLGVLSGDTLKSATDIGVPMVAIGLLYRYGYFRQSLSADGWQQERYEENDWYQMPIELVRNGQDEPLSVTVDIDRTPVVVYIWKVQVGLIPLYMLDTNIPENATKHRDITSVLYGGDNDMRIRQEIVLGIGGVKALKALEIDASMYHMNEGHAWFLTLERIRQTMQSSNLSFREASQYIWATTVFTTHTPVPAGNERFDPVLIHRYLKNFLEELGVSFKDFLAMGRVFPSDETESFCMTVAALKNSAFANGVSKLHGVVSREMWHNVWPNLPRHEIPIKAITNGVHPASWLAHEMKELYDSYFGPRYVENPGALDVWTAVHKIPDAELWRTHNRRRERLVFFARKRLKQQMERRGATRADLHRAEELLDPRALTIGFARRFSTYKRGNLLFSDPDRLDRIVNDPDCPVQIIISGKAHPLDKPGKEIIRQVLSFANEDRFRNRIVFIEDYDINVARYLVQGADVWLNNPRRPLEASGTSGMKAALNGVLNLSVLDGWWDEGFSDQIGFKIGNGEEYKNVEIQDLLEAEMLYSVLEREVKPLFYERNDSRVPLGWLSKMKATIEVAGQQFSAQRMLMDYTNRFYVKALEAGQNLMADDYRLTREVTAWLDRMNSSWNKIKIVSVDVPDVGSTLFVGHELTITVRVYLGDLTPDDVEVEVVAGRLDAQEQIPRSNLVQAQQQGDPFEGVYAFEGKVVCSESGRFGISARILPKNEHLPHTVRPKLINWWQ